MKRKMSRSLALRCLSALTLFGCLAVVLPARTAVITWQQLPIPLLASTLPVASSPGMGGQWKPVWALRIENINGGAIGLMRPDQPEKRLGTVLRPARAFTRNAFYAGAYGPSGVVVATSRKALRLRSAGTTTQGNGAARFPTLTLLPSDWRLGFESQAERTEIETETAAQRSHLWTDCRDSLFAEWAPAVGSPVFYRQGAEWRPLGARDPSQPPPTELLIVAVRPSASPAYVELENWTEERVRHWQNKGLPAGADPNAMPSGDGRALAVWKEGRSVPFAAVYQRVMGVGRLDDTGIAQPGQICTNHPGDVAVSVTSTLSRPISNREESDQLAGFQILPVNHARNGMVDSTGKPGYPIGATPWMIVGPLQREIGFDILRRLGQERGYKVAPPPEGTAPLFMGCLSPRYFAGEDQSDSVPGSRRGHLVRISTDLGRTWKRLPVLDGSAQNRLGGLDAVTNIRLYLPNSL